MVVFEYKHVGILITSVMIDDVHSHYILFRNEGESFVPITKMKDLDTLKALAKEEYLKAIHKPR